MYFGGYYIAAQEVTSNYVLYYILCVDKDYIFSKVKFYLTRLCSSCISTLPRFGATLWLFADDRNVKLRPGNTQLTLRNLENTTKMLEPWFKTRTFNI
jgi:hypothetical protein